jgi:AraC-like DNA-binding protein
VVLPRGNDEQPANRTVNQRTAILPLRSVELAMQTPVLQGLIPLAAGTATSTEPRVDQPALECQEAQLLYCTKGAGWCEINGCRHRVMAGDLYVMPPGASRVYGTDNIHGWSFCWVHAAGSNLEFFLQQLQVSRQRPLIRIGEDLRILGWVLELVELLDSALRPGELLYASQTLAHLLSSLACRQPESPGREQSVSHRIERTIDYMRQHLAEPLRAGTLASVANMSLPHYFALFKRSVGTTPIDYFIKLRMEQARRLLAETPWSIKEIASSLGYEDPLYFSRVFKAVTRATPSNYRVGQSRPEIQSSM